MRPSITLALLVATVGAANVGCRDSAVVAPPRVLDIREPSGSDGAASSDDSSSTSQPTSPTAPADPGPPPDTAISPPPPRPASFTVTGVAVGVEPGADTTRTVRIAAARARLYRVKAADGGAESETLVGSALADANGEFIFANLASAHYRLDVEAPPDGTYIDGSVSIAPPWSTQIRIHVLLHRKS